MKQGMAGNMIGPGGMGQGQIGPGGGAMTNQMGPASIPDPLSSLQHMTFTPGMQPQQMGMLFSDFSFGFIFDTPVILCLPGDNSSNCCLISIVFAVYKQMILVLGVSKICDKIFADFLPGHTPEPWFSDHSTCVLLVF